MEAKSLEPWVKGTQTLHSSGTWGRLRWWELNGVFPKGGGELLTKRAEVTAGVTQARQLEGLS